VGVTNLTQITTSPYFNLILRECGWSQTSPRLHTVSTDSFANHDSSRPNTSPLLIPSLSEEPAFPLDETVKSADIQVLATPFDAAAAALLSRSISVDSKRPVPAPRTSLSPREPSIKSDEFNPSLYLQSFFHKDRLSAKKKHHSDVSVQYDPPPDPIPAESKRSARRKFDLVNSSPYPHLFRLLVHSSSDCMLNQSQQSLLESSNDRAANTLSPANCLLFTSTNHDADFIGGGSPWCRLPDFTGSSL